MKDEYTIFNNGSKSVRKMIEFFENKKIPYVVINKEKDSSARIFPPNNETAYREKSFKDLKAKLN